MPLAQAPKIIKTEKPVLVRDESLVPEKPIAVDSHYEPRRSLLTHLSGARWIVNYYKQVKTSETASEGFNYHRPLPYQQYRLIENFEMRVTTPLNEAYDDESSTMSSVGVSIIPPSIVPDHGDHFIADIGDGRTGFFQIKQITPKTYFKDTAYEVEYELIDYVNQDLLDALNKCVVFKGYFERSYADFGANPVLAPEEHKLFQRINKWQERIARHYFDSFYSTEYATFLVPVEGMVVYDPFLVEFTTKIWDNTFNPSMDRLRVYARDNKDNLHTKTIWDTIISMDPYSLAKVKKNFALIPRRLFSTGLACFGSFTYSRIDYIYHPIENYDPILGKIIIPNAGPLKVDERFSEFATSRSLSLPMLKLPGLGFVHESLQSQLPIPDAKKYGSYDTYVLSPAFYDRDRKNMSKVERILMDAINGDPVIAKDLLPILEDCINWGEMERFYYIPLLTALARSALGDLSQ